MKENYYNKNNSAFFPNIRYLSRNESDYNNIKYYSKDFTKIKNLKSNFIEQKINDRKKPYMLYNEFNEDNINTVDKQLEYTNLLLKNKLMDKREIEKEKKDKIILPNISKFENKKNISRNYIKRNFSQINYSKSDLNLNKTNGIEFTNFLGKIKISNFYKTSEIIFLIENIIKEFNLKKDYSFEIKDSLMTFTFIDAEEALIIFRKLNLKKLKNSYFQNIIIDINFEIKNEENIKKEKKEQKYIINKELIKNKEKKEIKDEEKKENNIVNLKEKKILSVSKRHNKMEKFKNLKKYNYSKDNIFKDNLSDQQFAEIYKKYVEYFKQRKEERKKRELSYKNGKNISLQASIPYIENKNYFVGNLRKYNENEEISPSKFEGYIGKASAREDNYNDSHLYEVPDFINHWKLREDINNKEKWVSSC